MTIYPPSVAVDGIGYGPLPVATMGYFVTFGGITYHISGRIDGYGIFTARAILRANVHGDISGTTDITNSAIYRLRPIDGSIDGYTDLYGSIVKVIGYPHISLTGTTQIINSSILKTSLVFPRFDGNAILNINTSATYSFGGNFVGQTYLYDATTYRLRPISGNIFSDTNVFGSSERIRLFRGLIYGHTEIFVYPSLIEPFKEVVPVSDCPLDYTHPVIIIQTQTQRQEAIVYPESVSPVMTFVPRNPQDETAIKTGETFFAIVKGRLSVEAVIDGQNPDQAVAIPVAQETAHIPELKHAGSVQAVIEQNVPEEEEENEIKTQGPIVEPV